ncbi:MAG TPA: SNF2-related protein [Pirellulales bacterium]|nr:SNF2-related protein [Pirellulales bacterium]
MRRTKKRVSIADNLSRRCESAFSSTTWRKGQDYWRQGRVSIVDIDRHALLAEVRGREGNYQVEIDWGAVEDEYLDCACNCQRGLDGFVCKHVAATIMHSDGDPRMPPIRGEGALAVLSMNEGPSIPRSEFDEDVYADFNWPIETDARGRNARSRWRKTTWRDAIRAMAWSWEASDSRDHASGAKKHQLFYQISLVEQQPNEPLMIEFIKRTIKRDGTLGVPSGWGLDTSDIEGMADAADREILALLLGTQPQQHLGGYYHGSLRAPSCQLSPVVYNLLLPRLAATGRFGWVRGIEPRREEIKILRWDDGPPWKFKLVLSAPQAKSRRKLWPKLYREGEEADLSDVLLTVPGCILFHDRLCRLDPSVRSEAVEVSRQLPDVDVPASQIDRFVAESCQTPGLPPLELADDLAWRHLSMQPQPRVSIAPIKVGANTLLIGKLSFDYGGRLVDAEDDRSALCDTEERQIVPRDEEKERDAKERLRQLGARPTDYAEQSHGTFKVARQHFATLVLALNEAGWQVEAEGHRIRRPGATHVSLTSGIDWLEIDGRVDYDGEQVGLPKLLAALRRGEEFVTLGDGSRGMLPSEWLARYAPLAQMGEAEGDKVRFKPSQAWLLDAWLSAQPEVDVDAAFEQLRKRLRSFEGVRPRGEPAGFVGVLRPYQRDGLGWLLFLEEFGFGGCLADDMGLGKTIQVLAMLAERRKRSRDDESRPSLVVVPRSLVRNWVEEARRFTPELRVLDYTGLARGETRQQFPQYDLVVTTYGTLRRDAGHLKDLPFEYAILDEAQAIKNAASQGAKACRLIQAERRLAMTGTPVENHLGELWSLFDFLNPGMLGRSNNLKMVASKSAGDGENLRLLAKALRPFILRRTKEQVLHDLPAKTEQTLYCELEGTQRKLYDELRTHYRSSLGKRIESQGIAKAKIHVLEALLRLRQAACHPGLLDKSMAKGPSAKLETLLERLQEVFDEGHKALVFSQFTSLLALVRGELDERNIVYEYLDGRTHDRQKRVDRFQTDPACSLFLISLKAGGLGLNLTAADYVFILDPWWNPAVEAQAVDRAHRIGQTRRVFAYRLIARDTVEEKILQLQGDKRQLADAIISADNSLIGHLTADDLQMLLS